MSNLRNIELVATACDSSKITAYSWVQLVVIRAKHVDVQKAWSEKLIDPLPVLVAIAPCPLQET